MNPHRAASRAAGTGAAILGALLITAVTHAVAATALPQRIGEQEVPSLAPMIEVTAPAVVNIAVRGTVATRDPMEEFRRFFGQPPAPQRQRQFQGYILTNHHVVENADEITVTLLDDRSLEAEVVGSDAGSDIAVLKVDSEDLVALPLADSSKLRVGDFVVAIGNPFGLQHTVTSGIVSALGRSGINPEGYEDFIQTDASINPGNSGGALVDLNGRLVGINSAIFTRTGGNIGIGFAIPVNMARTIMEQILQFGSVRRGLLGVTIASVTPEIAENYDLKETRGALVTSVSPNSAAETAGVAIDDIITAVNGEPVEDAGQLRNAIGLLRAGEKVRIDLLRDGKRRGLTATLGEAETIAQRDIGELDPVFQGAQFLTSEEGRPEYAGTAGVLVADVEAGSPAAVRGLRPGDVITHVNRQRVLNLSEFRDIIDGAPSVILRVRRGGRGVLILMR
jgi:Do/DeqQ family serine protease